MIERGVGVIINVSSIVDNIPTEGNVTYGATKSFLTAFSQSLQVELQNTGVRVQALCPSFTKTEFHQDIIEFRNFKQTDLPEAMWMTAEDVVKESLAALRTTQVVVIPGALNKVLRQIINTPILGDLVLSRIRQNF